MTIPTYITCFRLFIGPIFLFLYLNYQSLGIPETSLPYYLLSLWAILELTDILDGVIARRYNMVSDLGKILDPTVDSISRISIFLTFTQGFIQVPMYLVFVFLYRDFVIGALRTVCALKGFALAARTSGKIKAIIQATCVACILVLMIPYSLGYLSLEALQTNAYYFVAATALYVLFSAFDYLYANRSYVKRLMQRDDAS